MTRSDSRPQVAVIYCPLWHNYNHASSWKGEGWCEWELLKSATPRFEGHYQPLRPSWGCFDESDPKWAAREISLAADHGVDVFLFDWYWYSGVKIMEEALERGFLKAPNRGRIKFALMWANHNWGDYFPAPFGREWNSWLPSRHTPDDLERVMDYAAKHYFRRSNYWRVDGRLFFSIFQPVRFVKELGGESATRKILARVDRRLAAGRLPPVHWNAMSWNAAEVASLGSAGFRSTTSYGVVDAGREISPLVHSYVDLVERYKAHWQSMSAAPLVHCPVVMMGWDVTPRCEKDAAWPFPPDPRTKNRDYPYCQIVTGNTPELFERLCRNAREHVERDSAKKPFAVFVNAWNEWTEGSYLLPEKRTGTAHLKALRRAFGR